MIDRWKAKYKDSPYKVMNFQKELDRMRREELAEKKRVEELRRHLLLKSMTGKYNDKLVDPESLSLVPVVDQLALQYRRHLMDESKVTWESDELDKLGSLEFQDILKKFPKLEKLHTSMAAQELKKLQQESASASVISSDSSSLRPSWYPHSHRHPSTSHSRSKTAEGGASSFTGVLEYHTPGSQMRALEEDLSMEFGQVPPLQPSPGLGSANRSPLSQSSMKK
ncbi:hypothetical protein EON65_28810 [archaeon]|nr:MAG: hypothetical protein EON65_28810 [archaeon]